MHIGCIGLRSRMSLSLVAADMNSVSLEGRGRWADATSGESGGSPVQTAQSLRKLASVQGSEVLSNGSWDILDSQEFRAGQPVLERTLCA